MALLDSENDLWDTYPETFIIPSTKGEYLTREKLEVNLGLLNSLGFNINKNFVWYSEDTTISVVSPGYGDYEWSYHWPARPTLPLEWKELKNLFEPNVVLHVFKNNDCFISQVCGNFSRNACNPVPPTIYGYKFNDINGNGTLDAGEPGLSEWQITLYRNGNPVAQKPTNNDGRYEFLMDAEEGLTPGTYTLAETMQPDWIATSIPGTVTVEPGPHADYGSYNFGNFHYGKIYGYKRNDIDANGSAGSNPGLSDWTIQLYRNGAYYGSDTTDANGYYDFNNLPAGNYTVKEVIQAGWYATVPSSGEHTGIVITSGAEIRRDFYNFNKGSIEVLKWQDMNEDRFRNTGDDPLSGWEITLTCLTGVDAGTSWTKTTDPDGKARFTSLRYGQYKIEESIPSDWVQTYPLKATGNPAHQVTITSGLDLPTEAIRTDFGNYQYGSIEVLKWEDMNENGVKDAGDDPLAGWSISLTCQTGDAAGQQWTKMTGADGKILFEDLHAGDYTIAETIPDGWVQTYPLEETGNSTHAVTITSGLNLPTETMRTDFGNFKLVEISAIKWDDSNVDGQQNDVNGKMSGWTIVLYKNGAWFAEEQTDANGVALFTGLHYGDYTVHERMQDDWRQTTPLPADLKSMPNPGELGEASYGPYEALSGSTWYELPFGNVQLGSATKIVQHYWWEWLMAGFEVSLEELDVPGLLDNVMDFPVTGVTDENGSMYTEDLLPGQYHFTLTLPAGWYEDSQDSDTFDLEENEDEEVVNRVYDNPNREPRTLGFWQNWRLRYSVAEMEVLIALVKVGSDNFSTLAVETIDAILCPSNTNKISMEDMARMQYLTLWLNLASQRLGFTPIVDLSPISGWAIIIEDNYGADDGVMTIHELMKELVRVYNSGELTRKGDLEIFKDICDAVNNYLVFRDPPTGPID
jgi:hypothetical protein